MYAVVDIGGTKTRVAVSNDLETLSPPVIFDTPQNYQEGVANITENVRKQTSAPLKACVIGVRGVVSDDGKRMANAPWMDDWRNKPLGEDIERALGGSTMLINDAALVGLGEAVYGAGKGAPISVYITISTGVNGARIVREHIDESRFGFEIGGQYISLDPLQTLEDYISGRAVTKRFGVHPRDLGKHHDVWEELARITAIGVHNSLVYWSPDVVILGGSMCNDIGISIERVDAHVRSIMKKFPNVPEIKHSALGDIGGLWGGVALLRSRS